MNEMINNSQNISISVKADAYDLLCKAYIEGVGMDFSLFGRRSSGYNSISEYVGYAFIQMALKQGAVEEAEQQTLVV